SPWWYRTALRLLGERRDRSVAPLLEEFLSNKEDTLSLRGLSGLYAVGAFDDKHAARALEHHSPWVRSWAVRLLGESGQLSTDMLKRLTRLAKEDSAAEVRSQLASTAQRLNHQDTLPMLQHLMEHKEDAHDPFIPLMLWLAYEPRLVVNWQPALEWLG